MKMGVMKATMVSWQDPFGSIQAAVWVVDTESTVLSWWGPLELLAYQCTFFSCRCRHRHSGLCFHLFELLWEMNLFLLFMNPGSELESHGADYAVGRVCKIINEDSMVPRLWCLYAMCFTLSDLGFAVNKLTSLDLLFKSLILVLALWTFLFFFWKCRQFSLV